jgi:CTP synthase (UTP-ammonia lyase)
MRPQAYRQFVQQRNAFFMSKRVNNKIKRSTTNTTTTSSSSGDNSSSAILEKGSDAFFLKWLQHPELNLKSTYLVKVSKQVMCTDTHSFQSLLLRIRRVAVMAINAIS